MTLPDDLVVTATPLQPGDTVLIALARQVDEAELERMATTLRKRHPGVAFTVVPDVAYISINKAGRANIEGR